VWEIKDIVGMSGNLVIYSKILPSNKPMPSIISMSYKTTLTPIPSIRVGKSFPISPIKTPIPFLVIPHKIILILLVFNIELLNSNLYNLLHLKSPI